MNKFKTEEIDVRKIVSSGNVRTERTEINDLAESIKSHGIINQITVYFNPGVKKYFVVAGHRRLEAASSAGLNTVPCHVIEFESIDKANEIAIAENVMRIDMTPYEECVAVHSLIGNNNTPAQIAKRFGRSLRWVLVREKLAKAGDEVLAKVKDGKISVRLAAKVADIPDEEFAEEMRCCYKLDEYNIENIIKRHHMDLKKAPFDTKCCETCDRCSACQQDLFDEDSKKTCLDPECWKNKIRKFAAQKADELNREGTIAEVQDFSYGNECYDNSIRYYEKKEIEKAEESGVKKRCVVNPDTGKVTLYYDKRDMPGYHEETDEEREQREQEEAENQYRKDARDFLYNRNLANDIKESVNYFGYEGIIAFIVLLKPYDIVRYEYLEKIGIKHNYGKIELECLQEGMTVGKLALLAKNSIGEVIEGYCSEKLEKAWEIFCKDENVKGKQSLSDKEPTEEEIDAEVDRIKEEEERQDDDYDDLNNVDSNKENLEEDE